MRKERKIEGVVRVRTTSSSLASTEGRDATHVLQPKQLSSTLGIVHDSRERSLLKTSIVSDVGSSSLVELSAITKGKDQQIEEEGRRRS